MTRSIPKNLDVMREKIVLDADHVPIDKDHNCRALIEQYQVAEQEIVENLVLTIQEVSKILGVSQQTLRNWDETGRLVPETKTVGGHRRYTESQILPLVKKQLSLPEIFLPGVTPNKLRQLGEMLLASFQPDEKINLSIKQEIGRVRIIVDSYDGLTTISKSFNMEKI